VEESSNCRFYQKEVRPACQNCDRLQKL